LSGMRLGCPWGQLIITAVVVEGRPKTEARDYGVSRYWVQQSSWSTLSTRRASGFQPRSRRPHHSPHAVDAHTEEMIIRLRKELSKAGRVRRRRNHHRTSGPPPAGGVGADGAGVLDHLADLVSTRFPQSATTETAAVEMGRFCAEQPNERLFRS
jgi:hypothetical protein